MKVLLAFITCGVAAGTPCDDYCSTQSANCVGTNAIDFDTDCATDCATWNEGMPSDTGDNSVYCRLYHAGAAADAPATHCPHAAPDGGGVCTACAAYCAEQAANCVGDNAIDFDTSCAADCATWEEGMPSDTGANTVDCRLYHATAAADAPATHCPHAAPDGGGVCTTCAAYCAEQAANCVGANAIDFDTNCATDCATWNEGMPSDTGDNSVYCRLYHAGAAADAPATHCPHAAPDGGGVCTACAAYCSMQAMNCVGANAIVFATNCATECATWDEGMPSDTGADSVDCRLYHATAAGGDPALHCPHAAPDGGGVCVGDDTSGAHATTAVAAAVVLAACFAYHA